MGNEDRPGASLHDADAQTRRAAAALMGSARTERKVNAARQNAARATEARRGQAASEETRAKLRAAQQARRERERQEREAAGLAETPGPKRPRGRPRKTQQGQADG